MANATHRLTPVPDGPSHRMLFDWAVKHLGVFEEAAEAWATDSAQLFASQVDVDALTKGKPMRVALDPRCVGIEVVFDQEWPIEQDWALVVNDVIRCFRCSLDHLAYALAFTFTDPLPDQAAGASEFPIYSDPLTKNTANRKIGAIDPAAQAIIKGLQPNNAGDHTQCPLWVLHELDRRSKHRVLPVITQLSDGIKMGYNPDVQWAEFHAGPLEEGAVVAAFATIPSSDNTVNMNLSFFPEVALGDGLPHLGSAVETLTAIREKIEKEVFTPLEKFLI